MRTDWVIQALSAADSLARYWRRRADVIASIVAVAGMWAVVGWLAIEELAR